MTPLNGCLDRLRAVAPWALLVSALSSIGPAFGDPLAATSQDRQIAHAVTFKLQTGHLTEHKMDDEISQRCLAAFLESLDPWKLYFRQSDVDRFAAREKELDDLVRDRKLEEFLNFAHTVFSTMLQRVDQTAVMAVRVVMSSYV